MGVVADVFVCDMIAEADQTLTALETAVESGLLHSRAFIILTLKGEGGQGMAKKAWEQSIHAQLDRMRGMCPDAWEVHLLANTKNETTLLGRLALGVKGQETLTPSS